MLIVLVGKTLVQLSSSHTCSQRLSSLQGWLAPSGDTRGTAVRHLSNHRHRVDWKEAPGKLRGVGHGLG